ncbi:MAG TPA: Uma2 family endonuclease [Blastocatellia bacterium]|nr:Uma2 family endonuclease [Blastocatellia bacterium]
MATTIRWTSADLEKLPHDEMNRYEIIEGELFVSKTPHTYHQLVCMNAGALLKAWNDKTGSGLTMGAPGVIFSEDNDVIPDVVWISKARFQAALGAGGHLYQAPELVIEVLSPGSQNTRRDRELKLKLYSRCGVDEYWIMDWPTRRVEVFRRTEASLQLVSTLDAGDTLTTPLLAGFAAQIASFFEGIPPQTEADKNKGPREE